MLILVIGGSRSGKSAVAETVADRLPPPVIYVATLTPDPTDPDLSARIEAHRQRRPASWQTANGTADLPAQLSTMRGTVVLDSVGGWLAQHQPDATSIDALCRALSDRSDNTVVVSDEVGMSVHPATEAGRLFRDLVGTVNQRLSAIADRSLFVVAGRVVALQPPDIDAIVNGASQSA